MDERGALLTVTQASELLGRSRAYAYRLLKRGGLPGVIQPIPGGDRFVRRNVLEAWLRGDVEQSA